MIFNISGGGGTALNFKVVGGTSAPSSPKENTIWVNTNTEIPSWDVSATQPWRRSKNKNLIVYPYFHTTQTTNGVTFTDNGDGTVTAKGTATANAYFRMAMTSIEEGMIWLEPGTYTMSGGQQSGIYAQCFSITDNVTLANCNGSGKTFTITKGQYVRFSCIVQSGKTVDFTFKPQLEKGSSATSFVKGDATGQVWIVQGQNSIVPFNALKKNGIMVCPISTKQYINVAWVSKTASIYQNEAWTSNMGALYLYSPGNTYDSITGGWSDDGYAYDSDSPAGGGTVASGYLQAAAGTADSKGYEGCIGTQNSIDLTGYNTLYVDGYTSAVASTSAVYVTTKKNYLLDEMKIKKALPASRSTVAIDISSITGKHYIVFGASYSQMATSRVYNMWLE